jgi:cytochrome P450
MAPPAIRSVPLLGDLLAFRRDRLGFLTRLAREQGDVARFRIGPYRVWQLAHPDLVHDVLVTHAQRFRKGPVLQRAKLVLGDGLLTSEGDHHRRHRRLLNHAFHPDRITEYAAVMVDRAASTSDRWVEGAPIDVHAQTVRMTLATAGATLLGTEVEAEVDLVEQAIEDLLSAYQLAFVPFGWRLQNLPVGPARRLQRGRAALHGLVGRAIAERRATGEDHGDLLSSLVLADPSDRLTDDEIRDEALTLLLAGHETTANALAFCLHLLAEDPEVEARVHAEVDAVLDGRRPTAEDRDRLPVCRGVFAEALRLFPPSWAMGREALTDHHIDGYDGEVVRAGEVVVAPQWVIHRDPRWWAAPDRCDPDRWSPAATASHPRSAFFPFGGGARQCIGEGFARTEGVLALATLTSRWRLRPVPERPLTLEPLITLRPRNGMWLRPERRTT